MLKNWRRGWLQPAPSIYSRKERILRMYSSSSGEEEKSLFGGEKHSLVRESIGSARVSEGEGCVGSSGWRNVLSSCEMQCDDTGSDAILFTVGKVKLTLHPDALNVITHLVHMLFSFSAIFLFSSRAWLVLFCLYVQACISLVAHLASELLWLSPSHSYRLTKP